MSKNMTWMLVAPLGVLVSLTSSATANELRFSGLEQRLAAVERQLDQQQGVRAAAYLSDDETSPAVTASPPNGSCDNCCSGYGAPCGTYYGEAQVMWIRPHISEGWIGKLSEEHHVSTRYVMGYEDSCGVGGRIRYWHFDHTIDVLDPDQRGGLRVEVIDVEGTNHLYFCNTDVLLAGGFRYTSWDIDDDQADRVSLDAYGLSMAADVRTGLYQCNCDRWSLVYGGRMSILGGDWNGDNDIIIGGPDRQVRDDNLLITELYSGVEYMFRYFGYDLYARGVVELQNWRSDVLGTPRIGVAPVSINSADSIGFLGFGFHVGAAF